MNLTRLFRKYSKPLLMVVMSLLLVAFLIPSTIQGCGSGSRSMAFKRGEVFGRTVSQADLDLASHEHDLLVRLDPQHRLGIAAPITGASRDPALDYYLLTQEARQIGVRVGRDEVIARLRAYGFTDQIMQQLYRMSGRRSYDELYEIIGRGMAVNRLLGMEFAAFGRSLAREERDYRANSQQATADISVVMSRAFAHEVPEPTEEQLQAFFDECKERETAHAEEELVFGYRLPDRVQIEYLTVRPDNLRETILIKEDDVRDYFADNAQRYTKIVPTTQPTQGPPPRVPMSFEEAESRARDDLRNRRAREAAQSLVNDIAADAQRSWGTEQVREDGFSAQPTGDIISFEELKQRFSTPDRPVEYHRTELLDLEGLRALRGFGQAMLRKQLSAPDLALRVKGILDRAPDDNQPVINLMEPAPVVLTSDYDPQSEQPIPNQAYLFRVIQVARNAPPESMDGIRDQVIEDWKLTQAHELARAAADKLAARAREIGLRPAVEGATDLKATLLAGEQAVKASSPEATLVPPDFVERLKPVTPERLTRNAGFVQAIGNVERLPDAVFALADTPVDEGQHRVTVVPRAAQFQWIVAQLDEIKPLYRGAFEQQLAFMRDPRMRAYDREAMVFHGMLVAPENLQQRTGFKSAIDRTPQRPAAPPAR